PAGPRARRRRAPAGGPRARCAPRALLVAGPAGDRWRRPCAGVEQPGVRAEWPYLPERAWTSRRCRSRILAAYQPRWGGKAGGSAVAGRVGGGLRGGPGWGGEGVAPRRAEESGGFRAVGGGGGPVWGAGTLLGRRLPGGLSRDGG